MSTPHGPGPEAQGHGYHGHQGHGHPGQHGPYPGAPHQGAQQPGQYGAPQSPYLQPGQPGAYGGPPPPKRSTANVVLIVFVAFIALNMLLGVIFFSVVVLGGVFGGMGTGASPTPIEAAQAVSAILPLRG